MVIQIIISLLIYGVIYIIQNNNYIFSQEFLNKVQKVDDINAKMDDLYKKNRCLYELDSDWRGFEWIN